MGFIMLPKKTVGVSYNKRDKKWRAYISVNKKLLRLGSFEIYQDAVNARKEAEAKYENEINARSKLIKQRIENIKNDYIDGTTAVELSKKYNLSLDYIREILSKNNLTSHSDFRINLDIDFIKKMYLSGKSSVEIAERLNTSGNNITRRLKREGIEIRGARLYELVDKNFLDNLEEDWKCYFIGLFWSDGNMKRNRPNIRINLQKNDGYILDYLCGKIYTSHKTSIIIPHKNAGFGGRLQDQTLLEINCREAYNKLLSMGASPAKSLVCPLPNLDGDQFWSFLRGYIDGDGCIDKDGKSLRIYCSDKFATQLQEKLKTYKIKSYIYKRPGSKISEVSISQQTHLNFIYDNIYKNSEICLERKRLRFRRAHGDNLKLPNGAKPCCVYGKNYRSLREASDATGMSRYNIKKLITENKLH